MNFTMLLLFCLSLVCFKSIEAVTRTEITSQYRPTLNQIKATADQKLKESTEQYSVLHGQIEGSIFRTRNITQSQINSFKAFVADAKKAAVNSSSILACVRVQESQANMLSTAVLNQCALTNNYTDLLNCKSQFQTISTVAWTTVNWCSSLNPLVTQDKPYEECLAYKIPDLNLQINLVQNQYFDLSNSTLKWKQECLARGATAIFTAIGNINYQISMCQAGL